MMDQAQIVLGLERQYRSEGLVPVRWHPAIKKGCRGCGDTVLGPWTVSIMSSLVPERKEVLIFVVTLCRKCQGNEDRRDDVAEKVVKGYLKRPIK